jgi:hypothetical protein
MHRQCAGGLQREHDVPKAVGGPTQLVGRCRHAVDGKPFGQVDEMRRRIPSRTVACGAQDGIDQRRDGSLAVGPCDVDGRVRALGIPESREDGADVLEPEFDAEVLEAEQVLERIASH